MNPSRPPLVPSWDLSIVLAGLQRGPFEPLDSVELKFLSLKTALLTALTSIKQVGDLQAFSVSEECLVFGPVYSQVVQFFPPITYPTHRKKLAQCGDCRILQRCSVSRSPQLCRCLPKRRRAPTYGKRQGSHHALPRSGGEPASTALGGGRFYLSVAVSRKSIAHMAHMGSREGRLSPNRGWPTG